MATRRNAPRRRRRMSSGEKAVLALCIVLFLGLVIFGVVRSFIAAPELPENDQSTQTDLSDMEEVSDEKEEDIPKVTRKEHYFNILLSGLDDGNGGSDTNILLSLDAENKVFNAVSIPRDTLIDVTWNVKKFNASYNVGGVDRMKEELTKLLGVPVDFYISVDLQGFEELVDAIGGVTFDVPRDMNYYDPTQNLRINIKAGEQLLNGSDALKVVRWRQNSDGTGYANGDLGRIETQQKFLMAVAKQMLAKIASNPVDAISTYVNLFYEYIETDLEIGNLIWMGEQALAAGMENIHFHTLPGDGAYVHGGSYYVLDPEATLTLMNECFNPYTTDLTSSDLDIPVS